MSLKFKYLNLDIVSNFVLRASNFRKQSGFSFIEMLIVIFIVLLLTGITIVNFRAGEKQKQVMISAETVVTALRKAQGLTLAAKQLDTPCAKGKAPEGYLVFFESIQIKIYGIDKCGDPIPLETLNLERNNSLTNYKINNVAVPGFQILYTLPYAKLSINPDATDPYVGVFGNFTSASVDVVSTPSSSIKTVTIDGIIGTVNK